MKKSSFIFSVLVSLLLFTPLLGQACSIPENWKPEYVTETRTYFTKGNTGYFIKNKNEYVPVWRSGQDTCGPYITYVRKDVLFPPVIILLLLGGGYVIARRSNSKAKASKVPSE